jgi:hypothetical protein
VTGSKHKRHASSAHTSSSCLQRQALIRDRRCPSIASVQSCSHYKLCVHSNLARATHVRGAAPMILKKAPATPPPPPRGAAGTGEVGCMGSGGAQALGSTLGHVLAGIHFRRPGSRQQLGSGKASADAPEPPECPHPPKSSRSYAHNCTCAEYPCHSGRMHRFT